MTQSESKGRQSDPLATSAARREVWAIIATECLRITLRGRKWRFWLRRTCEAWRYAISTDPPRDWPNGNPHEWLRKRGEVRS